MCHQLQWHGTSLTAPMESWPLAMWFENLRAATEGSEVNGNPVLVGSGLKLSYESWISEGRVQHICVGVRQPRGVCSDGKDKLHPRGLGVSLCFSFTISGKTWDTTVMKATLPSLKGATRSAVHPLACSRKHQKLFLTWEIFEQGWTVAVCSLAAKHTLTDSPLAVLTPKLPLVVQKDSQRTWRFCSRFLQAVRRLWQSMWLLISQAAGDIPISHIHVTDGCCLLAETCRRSPTLGLQGFQCCPCVPTHLVSVFYLSETIQRCS